MLVLFGAVLYVMGQLSSVGLIGLCVLQFFAGKGYALREDTAKFNDLWTEQRKAEAAITWWDRKALIALKRDYQEKRVALAKRV